MERLQIQDRSFVLSPQTTSATSSSVENGMSGFDLRRSKLNAFLEECQIQTLGKPWLELAQATERTRQRCVQRSSEVISFVLKVVYPDDPGYLWTELQASTTISKMLGTKQCVPHLIEAILKLWQKLTRMQKHGTQGGRFYLLCRASQATKQN